jgi:hypothetical protein
LLFGSIYSPKTRHYGSVWHSSNIEAMASTAQAPPSPVPTAPALFAAAAMTTVCGVVVVARGVVPSGQTLRRKPCPCSTTKGTLRQNERTLGTTDRSLYSHAVVGWYE